MYSTIDPLLNRRRSSAGQEAMDGSRHSEKRYSYPGVMPIRGGPPSSPQLDSSGRRYVAPPQQQVRYGLRDQSPLAGEVLYYAFTSQQPQPTIFPPPVYPEPSRSSSRSEKASPRSFVSPGSTSGSTTGRSSLDSSRLSPPTTDSRERSYSPLAAGFARLNQKDGGSGGASPTRDARGRSAASKSSLPLESRMFAGPA